MRLLQLPPMISRRASPLVGGGGVTGWATESLCGRREPSAPLSHGAFSLCGFRLLSPIQAVRVAMVTGKAVETEGPVPTAGSCCLPFRFSSRTPPPGGTVGVCCRPEHQLRGAALGLWFPGDSERSQESFSLAKEARKGGMGAGNEASRPSTDSAITLPFRKQVFSLAQSGCTPNTGVMGIRDVQDPCPFATSGTATSTVLGNLSINCLIGWANSNLSINGLR